MILSIFWEFITMPGTLSYKSASYVTHCTLKSRRIFPHPARDTTDRCVFSYIWIYPMMVGYIWQWFRARTDDDRMIDVKNLARYENNDVIQLNPFRV
jgi:hypothetical protein